MQNQKENSSSSVIICTRNRIKDLVTCLTSLSQQTEEPKEIIVIDSSDISIEQNESFKEIFNKQTFNNSELIYKHTPKGLTVQRNIGIKHASKDVIYFFDDDVILQKDYLAQMNRAFKLNPNYIGGMGSIINMPAKDINIYRFLRYLFLLSRDYSSGKFTLSGQPTHSYGQKKFQTVQTLGGCCMAYRKQVFKKHRFDENLKKYAYMEDCDFSYRVSQDAPLFYNPNAILKHMQSPLDRDGIIDNKAMYIRNYIYLFFKNIYPRNKLKIIPFYWSIIGLFVEAILIRNKDCIKGYIKGIKTPLKKI
jgi:GT2 family glycosyltransferase